MIEEPKPFRKLTEGNLWDHVDEIAGDISKESPIVLDWIEQARESVNDEEKFKQFAQDLSQAFPNRYNATYLSATWPVDENFPAHFLEVILTLTGYLCNLDWKEFYHPSTLTCLSDIFELHKLPRVPDELIVQFDEQLRKLNGKQASKLFAAGLAKLVEQQGHKLIYLDNTCDCSIFGIVTPAIFEKIRHLEITPSCLIVES